MIKDFEEVLDRLRKTSDLKKTGMILSHIGIVRPFSRNKVPVKKVFVRVQQDKLEEILKEARKKQGISGVEVKIFAGERKVGELLMILMVAGDFRENVIRVLAETLDRIKKEVTYKEEF